MSDIVDTPERDPDDVGRTGGPTAGGVGRRPRVLVVGPDRTLLEQVAEVLASEGVPVAAASTGAEGIELARRSRYGVVVIDLDLEDRPGTEVVAHVRHLAPDLDVVVVAASPSTDDAVTALNLGAARFFRKPCPGGELRAVILELLERQVEKRRSRLDLHRLEVQNSLSESLSSALLPEQVARAAIDAVRGLGGIRVAAVLALGETAVGEPSPDASRLRPLAQVGIDAEAAAALAAMDDVRNLLSGRSVPAPGMAVIPSGPAGIPATRGPLALCRLRGRTSDLGVLALQVAPEFMRDEHHWDLLMAIANWVGVALERAMLYRRLEVAYQEVTNAQRRMVQAEKLSAVGRLAAGLAHEVGTPLNIISGRAEFLLKDAADDPRMSQGLKVIVQQIDRISRLIAQVLDFSREYGPVRDFVDLAAVMTAVQSLLDARLRKADTDLNLYLPPRLPRVTANFNQMQQVFINLLMNSIDGILSDPAHAGGKGRGRIVVAAEHQPRLRKVRVTVEDNGQGIAEEHLDKVFDPFFSTKPVGAGTGLGLAVVYGIVTEHGGTLDIDSTWGHGTAVHFTLPTEGD